MKPYSREKEVAMKEYQAMYKKQVSTVCLRLWSTFIFTILYKRKGRSVSKDVTERSAAF